MQTWEISEDKGKVLLEIGDTKGGLSLIHIDAELALTPWDARDLAEQLMKAADEVEALKQGSAR
jgi:hypothetical protein